MKFTFKKYNEINRSYFFTDLHMHSTWTDGKKTISEMVDKANKLSLTDIAITDHIRKSSTYFNKYHDEICRIRENKNMRIFIGYEAKVKNFLGEIDAPDEAKNKAELRIVSVHRFPIGKKLISPKLFTKKTCHDIELELSNAVLENNSDEFNILGHPGGMSLRFHGEFPTKYFDEIIYNCSKHRIAFDLNYSYHSSIIKQLKPILKKYNPFISIGSDAHISSNVGRSIKLYDKYFHN